MTVREVDFGEVAEIQMAAFAAALEALGREAFVVREDGAVLAASASGWAKVASRARALSDELRDAVQRRGDAPYDIVRLAVRASVPHYFAVLRPAPVSSTARLDEISIVWALTPRQRQVLALMAEGLLNKTIADRLGIVTGTVELHVTALYKKAGVGNRTALIARFWNEDTAS